MTDQDFRLALSLFFNGIPVMVALVYVGMTFVSYQRRKDSRALRAFVIALGLLAAVLAYALLSAGLVLVDAPRPPQWIRIWLFALRVVTVGVLVIACRVWWRNERERR